MTMKKTAFFLLLVSLTLIFALSSADGVVPSGIDDTNWMSGLPDYLPVTDISIPGTHDSGTACMDKNALIRIFALCQGRMIGEWDYKRGEKDYHDPGMLNIGIRHFDLRLTESSGQIVLVHNYQSYVCMLPDKTDESGAYERGEPLTLNQVWKWYSDFLKKHPSEFLIVEIKREDEDAPAGHGEKADKAILNYLRDIAEEDDSLIWAGDHVPTLGEARGKVIIISHLGYDQSMYRLPGTGKYWAIRMSWNQGDTGAKKAARYMEDNALFNSWNTELWVQNRWESVKVDEKWTYVQNTLKQGTDLQENAWKNGKTVWLINYASANNPWSVTPPFEYADKINAGIRRADWLGEGKNAFTGIVALDFCNDANPKQIWKTNYHNCTVTFDGAGGTAEQKTVQSAYGHTVEKPADPVRDGYTFLYWCWLDGGRIWDFSKDILRNDITLTACWKSTVPIPYVDAAGEDQPPQKCVDAQTSPVWSEQESGWYAVSGKTAWHYRLRVEGNVNLILCDDAELRCEKGIEVNEGSSLTVWRQDYGTGKLYATGSAADAGIGGNGGHDAGSLTFNGGNIDVRVPEESGAAGIGGGENGSGGKIRISGGSVRVLTDNPDRLYSTAAGIGGGENGNGGSITVTGGRVNVEHGTGGAGIGGGKDGNSGKILITGGTVLVKNTAGACIGGGNDSGGRSSPHDVSADVTITGGTVYVESSEFNGIGMGRSHGKKIHPSRIVIMGGNITALTGWAVIDFEHGVGTSSWGGTGNGTIELGWTSLTDSITSDGYPMLSDCSIILRDSFIYQDTGKKVTVPLPNKTRSTIVPDLGSKSSLRFVDPRKMPMWDEVWNWPSDIYFYPQVSETITIPKCIPERTDKVEVVGNLILACWNTMPNGSGENYFPGDTITVQGDTVLYAVWKEEWSPAYRAPEFIRDPVVITYDANGVEGVTVPDMTGVPRNSWLVLEPATAPAGGDRIFAGWSLAPWAEAPDYLPGDSFLAVQDTVFYAVWRPEYRIVEGAGAVWYQDSGVPQRFVANGSYRLFTGVRIDGKELTQDQYEASPGSTVVNISADTMQKLSVGEHTIEVIYRDGSASAEFRVASAIPKTGDREPVALWLVMVLAGILLLSVTLHRGKSQE